MYLEQRARRNNSENNLFHLFTFIFIRDICEKKYREDLEMKNLIAVALISTLFMLPGCSSEMKAYTDAGQVINTEVNQNFTIALASNPTTGYGWQPKFDNGQISLANKEYRADDTTGKQLVGSGGTEFFYFKALKSGETQIVFTYYRPWETPTPQDQTRIFAIKVK
jgi:inhibitor of cysteine peptidase